MRTYITKQGDQWDSIAKEIYGDETYINFLIENNSEYIDIFQFKAGIELKVPELPEDQSSDLPIWRR